MGGLNSPIVDNNGLAPSILNGGLGLISPAYWVTVVLMAAAVEGLGFTLKDKEMIHGRVAMVAIVAFAAQEAFSKISVVTEAPFMFKPIWSYLVDDLHSFDLSAGFTSY